MKCVTVMSCLLLCSIFALTSCTKNNETEPTAPPNGIDTLVTAPPKYAPGDTVIIKGDTSNNDQTVLLYSGSGGISQPSYPAFLAFGKEFGGMNGRGRSIMKFKLDHISDTTRSNPPQFQKAVLYLYQYNVNADEELSSPDQDVNNGAELHRIVGNWQDSSVSWSTQPALASGSANPLEDVIMIPSVTTPVQGGTKNNLEIDVTDMMRKIFASQENKGFLLKLTNESTRTGRSFGSFACPSVSKRPKLVLYF